MANATSLRDIAGTELCIKLFPTTIGSSHHIYSDTRTTPWSPTKDRQPRFITTPVFLSGEQLHPAGLLQILLIRAGIESNPGPTWYCSVCKCVLRNNQTSVKCNSCKEWCHLRPCSGLQNHLQWNVGFIGQCCKDHTLPTTNLVNTNLVNNSQPNKPLVIMQFNCRGGLRNKTRNSSLHGK